MKIAAQMMSGLVKLSLALTLAVSASVNAAPIINGTLGLTGGNPDIQSNFLDFDFSASTNTFEIVSAFGGALYTYNGSTQSILNSSFSIIGTADGSDANLGLSIAGDIGSGVETLLTGSLTSMANSGSGVFEFLFGSLGGTLASLYGSEAGVIFTDASLSGFDFTADVATQYSGRADAFGVSVPVSAPATFSLTMLGLILLAVARRKRF